MLQDNFLKMGKLCYLEQEFRGIKIVPFHPVLPMRTVISMFYTIVSVKLATFFCLSKLLCKML